MDRLINYAGAIPLETDLLNTNRNTQNAMGRLFTDLFGTSTGVTGLACTPTTVPSMAVKFGNGAIYQQAVIDSTAFSSLAPNTTDNILKQGLLWDSDLRTLTMTAPGTVGQSVIYLIEGALSETDSVPVVLPFYNAANPVVPFSGPGNAGTPSFTMRKCTVNLVAKAGAASASPVAPAVDAGFVPLYLITIAYGQTTITAPNIAVHGSAPFLNNITSLLSLTLPVQITTGGTGSTSAPAALTALGAAASGANVDITSLASAATVNGNTIGYRGVPLNSQSAAYTLVAGDAGGKIYHPSSDTTARTWTIPANASVAYPIDTAIWFLNDASAGAITIAINTDTLVYSPGGTTGSRTLAAAGWACATKVAATRWMISGSGLS
jgi:hypothetical protein